jgi:hypothetical protein
VQFSTARTRLVSAMKLAMVRDRGRLAGDVAGQFEGDDTVRRAGIPATAFDCERGQAHPGIETAMVRFPAPTE